MSENMKRIDDEIARTRFCLADDHMGGDHKDRTIANCPRCEIRTKEGRAPR